MRPEMLHREIWNCRGCGLAVVTAYSINGRRMCIEAEPADNGNLTLHFESSRFDDTHYLAARVYQRPVQEDALFHDVEPPDFLYIDHHANCEKADQF